jgi:hypothetical protein
MRLVESCFSAATTAAVLRSHMAICDLGGFSTRWFLLGIAMETHPLGAVVIQQEEAQRAL